MPQGATKVRHVILHSETEFMADVGVAYNVAARTCHRAAVALCAAATAALLPQPQTNNANSGNVMTQTMGNQTMGNMVFRPQIYIAAPEGGGKPKNPEPPKDPRRANDRPADPQKHQSNLNAFFGKPVQSYEGKSDAEVLRLVNWAAVESGGHTLGSKLSTFRNTFMADFVRNNPNLLFNKELEKRVRAESKSAYDVYKAAQAKPEYDEDVVEDEWYQGPEEPVCSVGGNVSLQGIDEVAVGNNAGNGPQFFRDDEAQHFLDGGPEEGSTSLIAEAKTTQELGSRVRRSSSKKRVSAKVKLAKQVQKKAHIMGQNEADEDLREEQKFTRSGVGSAMRHSIAGAGPIGVAEFEAAPVQEPAVQGTSHSSSQKKQEVEVPAAVEPGNGRKRIMDEGDEQDGPSDDDAVDIVQEAVNKGGASYTVVQLKVHLF